MDFTEHLTCEQLAKSIKPTPKGKASGADALMGEIIELGNNRTVSVMPPHYRVVLRPEMVSEVWNKVALNMMWKNKDSAMK